MLLEVSQLLAVAAGEVAAPVLSSSLPTNFLAGWRGIPRVPVQLSLSGNDLTWVEPPLCSATKIKAGFGVCNFWLVLLWCSLNLPHSLGIYPMLLVFVLDSEARESHKQTSYANKARGKKSQKLNWA